MHSEQVKFCPLCGTLVSREFRYGEQRPVCPSCGWIFFADPKVAAAMLVEREDGRVLLVRRVNEPYRGQWTLPAGFVDAGEDPAEAARRECLEETGLSVDVTGLLDIYAGREHRRGADFVIFYRGSLQGGELNPADDADAADWFEYSHLPPLAFRATEFILNKFKPAI
jgi:ADP-ribose pyrophosphatase YjhB (NUDIX family)